MAKHKSIPLHLPAGIGSYVTVLEPKPDQQGKMKYSLTLLIPKSRSAELEPLRQAALTVAKDWWGDKGPAILANQKYALIKDGDSIKDSEGKLKPENKGMFVISMRTDRKPGVLDAQKNPVFSDEEVYSGCMLRVTGAVFGYDVTGNRGVSFGLGNVQVLRKGTRFDGRKAAEEEFEEWVDPEGAADPLV